LFTITSGEGSTGGGLAVLIDSVVVAFQLGILYTHALIIDEDEIMVTLNAFIQFISDTIGHLFDDGDIGQFFSSIFGVDTFISDLFLTQ